MSARNNRQAPIYVVTAAFREGVNHAHADVRKGKKIRYRPSLIKSVLNDHYREQYINGYKHGFKQATRELRMKDLSSLPPALSEKRRER